MGFKKNKKDGEWWGRSWKKRNLKVVYDLNLELDSMC